MRLSYSPTALKKLKRIAVKDLPKVYRKIQQLKVDPLAGKRLQGEYNGEYALRAWPLRIIYTFDPTDQLIQIEDIDYRGSVYKN